MAALFTKMITGGGFPPLTPAPRHPLETPIYSFQLEGEKPVVIKSTIPWMRGDKLHIYKSTGNGWQ